MSEEHRGRLLEHLGRLSGRLGRLLGSFWSYVRVFVEVKEHSQSALGTIY